MWIAKTKTELRQNLSRRTEKRVLVPTMGALHAGHTALIDMARAHAGEDGEVLVSIFVNPIQFDKKDDLSNYPRPIEQDLALCESHGADGVFLPDPSEMYAADRSITVMETSLSQHLCGAARHGHFDGVCTVVLKLFLLSGCDAAVFGEKDFQQLAIIHRLVRDLDCPTEIIPHPTIREDDGLAMSSRNTRLLVTHRADAPRIYQALQEAAKHNAPDQILEAARSIITDSRYAKIDYLSLVRADDLMLAEDLSAPTILACAVFYGDVRLIDHIKIPAIRS
jgi:pantoate--beta-alanine ligase